MSKTETRKRNNRVQVRLDNKEHQAFLKAVKRSRLSQEVYLRHLINGVVPQEAPPPDYYSMMQQLYRIGTNLNQIAQKAHTLNVIDVQRYWSWYGFTERVDWCACFVSWCDNQCGYIEAGRP